MHALTLVVCNIWKRKLYTLKNKVYNLKIFGFLDVCSLRLDFETLTILGPATTGEADTTGAPAPGHLCQDSFTVTVRKNCIYFHLKTNSMQIIFYA